MPTMPPRKNTRAWTENARSRTSMSSTATSRNLCLPSFFLRREFELRTVEKSGVVAVTARVNAHSSRCFPTLYCRLNGKRIESSGECCAYSVLPLLYHGGLGGMMPPASNHPSPSAIKLLRSFESIPNPSTQFHTPYSLTIHESHRQARTRRATRPLARDQICAASIHPTILGDSQQSE